MILAAALLAILAVHGLRHYLSREARIRRALVRYDTLCVLDILAQHLPVTFELLHDAANVRAEVLEALADVGGLRRLEAHCDRPLVLASSWWPERLGPCPECGGRLDIVPQGPAVTFRCPRCTGDEIARLAAECRP